MKKNLFIILLILLVPVFAYMAMTKSTQSTARTMPEAVGKPEILKFTSAMCLDCQTMNKVFKEIFPKYEDKIILTEIQVQDGNSFTHSKIKEYDVSLVPTIILLNSNGEIVKRIEGAIDKGLMDKYLMELK